MEDAIKIMNDPETFCFNIAVRQVKALKCESVQVYIDRYLLPFFLKHGIQVEIIDISETAIYEIALQKAVEHAKIPKTTAEVESEKVKSIRIFYRNFETNKSTEHLEYVRVAKISGDITALPKDGYVDLY